MNDKTKFIDLFSGCGGLSLGLSMAGMEGQFAVERDAMAFSTFAANFLDSTREAGMQFAWPEWLPKQAWSIDQLLSEHRSDLELLRGEVQVIAGGPPCQGFSFAGRRQESDPRNLLFKEYVRVVNAVRPLALILENVPGMKVAHANGHFVPTTPRSYYERARRSLERIGYHVHGEIVDAARFGVPQRRPRLIVLGVRNDLAGFLEGGVNRAFAILERDRATHLATLGLSAPVSASQAISDLETASRATQPCLDPQSPAGFLELAYGQPRTTYQRRMHLGHEDVAMDSMRMARHRDDVRERFARILAECPRGVRMNEENRKLFGLLKHRVYPMASAEPAPTITTLPDDVLHYSEPRILTVRECARLQSFPDWFVFRGKYTTGGELRTKQCPRYTQVGNAVPPLLARAIGLAVRTTLDEASENMRIHSSRNRQQVDRLVTA